LRGQKNIIVPPVQKLYEMSEVENAGRKGYCLLYFFIFFVLFMAFLIYLYRRNFAGLPLAE